MIPDFSHLKNVSGADRREYIIHEMAGSPVLIVSPASRENPEYFGAALAMGQNLADRLNVVGKVDREALEEHQRIDRELYPAHVVHGWRGLKDAQGAEVPFEREAAQELFRRLPSDWLARLRTFCGNPNNFRHPVLSDSQARDLGGN